MSLPFAFWDTSALLPLCVRQKQTSQANALYTRYGLGVWWGTPVEIMSGLTRMKRSKEIDHHQFLAGSQTAQYLADAWESVNPSKKLAAHACTLLELYPLRAADALQLAAALDYFDQTPRGHVFITGDQRLADAARQSGLTVELI
jgi:hypothetical protein